MSENHGLSNIINASLRPSTVIGSPSIGRPIIPKYSDLILRFEDINSFPAIGDERLIYLDSSTTTLYLWSDSTSEYDSILNSNDGISINTTEYWNSQISYKPYEKEIIIYSDHSQIEDEHGNTIYVPGIKVGDGNAYLIDLPFVTDAIGKDLLEHVSNFQIHVSSSDRLNWNSKVSVEVQDETLVFNN